jgi:hypothetical protein
MQPPAGSIVRTLDPDISLFSAAEIRVVRSFKEDVAFTLLPYTPIARPPNDLLLLPNLPPGGHPRRRHP